MPYRDTRLVFAVVTLVVVSLSMYFVVMPLIAPQSQAKQRLNVFDGTLPVIQAGHYYGEKTTFSSNVDRLQLVGNFSCIGSGNDNSIRILLLNSTQLSTWNSTGALSSLYNSGVITSGSGSLNYTVAVPSGGVYYVVFGNTFDQNSPKTIHSMLDIVFSSN